MGDESRKALQRAVKAGQEANAGQGGSRKKGMGHE